MAKRFFSYEAGALGETKLENVKFKKDTDPFVGSKEAQSGGVLEFIPVHVKNAPVVRFMAFIESIKDNFRHDHTPNQPYGRPDPYYIWQKSSRTISVGWTVPSSSEEMALRNLNNLNLLISSMYPAYTSDGNAISIAASPLFRVKYANIISSAKNENGLLCAIGGVDVTPEVKSGWLQVKTHKLDGEVSGPSKLLIPKSFTLSCNLEVVHDHSLGWDLQTGDWRGGKEMGFPYGYGIGKGISTTTPAETPADEPKTDTVVAGAGDKVKEHKKNTILT
mgnify:CR=1 FL=1